MYDIISLYSVFIFFRNDLQRTAKRELQRRQFFGRRERATYRKYLWRKVKITPLNDQKLIKLKIVQIHSNP